jgi:hypothetical protein
MVMTLGRGFARYSPRVGVMESRRREEAGRGEIGKLVKHAGFTAKQPGPHAVRPPDGRVAASAAPKLVAEVQYDHFTAGRFRLGARFLP